MIGGNITAEIQIYTDNIRNVIGELIPNWKTIQSINGWLDLSNGDSKYTTYNAKIQESTHVFVADYLELDKNIEAENSRMVINEKDYDIMLIDNPMEKNKQLEIYLKYTGGQ